MTRAEYEAMTLDELLEWAYEEVNDLTTEEVLIQFAKDKIDDDNLYIAMHVLSAIYNSEGAYNDYYLYDYSMGTLETPTPVTCKEDFDNYLFFDDEV
jgi:hypothetical protein